MTNTFDIAVVGTTSLIGEAILSLLAERKFPVGKVYALDTEQEDEEEAEFGRRSLVIDDVSVFDFSSVQLAFFAAGRAISSEYALKAAQAGCKVIDTTDLFRLEPDVPLVIPEVNPEAIHLAQRNLIASPMDTVVYTLIALKALHDAAEIKRINIVTYQAVSSSGRSAVEGLAQETITLLNGRPIKPRVYPKQIAFNVLAQVDGLLENGYSQTEMNLVLEIRKILNKHDLLINPTTAQVPVFFGHSSAVHIEFNQPINATTARNLLQKAASVTVIDGQKNDGYSTPVTDAAGHDTVFVSRIRQDISSDTGLDLWLVADNIRKGAALNSVQIAELWLKN